MTKHLGEPVRYMSGEHGTFIAEDGDELPAWVTGGDTPTAGDTDATLGPDNDLEAATPAVTEE